VEETMRIITALVLALALAGCGGHGSQEKQAAPKDADSKRSVTAELPKGVKPASDVLRMRALSGVWKSAPGVLPDAPKETVQLEIAFDRSFTMTLWGKDPKGQGDAVFARQSGKIGIVKDGIAGSATDVRPSALKQFATWTANDAGDGSFTLSAASGLQVALRRVGN
jgi:hypothetical protein